MTRAKVNRVFKVSVISNDVALFDRLKGGIFGEDFDSSYLQTKGANFAYTKIVVPDSSEGYLMAQLWMLYPAKQWVSVRQAYYTGSSGLIVLLDPAEKDHLGWLRKLLREFVIASKGRLVPIMVVGVGEEVKKEENDRIHLVVKDIERWSGRPVQFVLSGDDRDVLRDYIVSIRNDRAKGKILATLNMYFALDSISRESRSISQIIKHLRSLNISAYFSLIPDEEMKIFIREVAAEMYFKFDGEAIIYRRQIP